MMSVGLCLWVCLIVCGAVLDIRLPPTITVGPLKQKVYKSGEDFTLPCVARGSPQPTYEWTFNNKRLDLNEYNNIKMSKEDGSLRVTDAASINKGEYQCFAKNEYGTAMSNFSEITRAFIASYPANIPVRAYLTTAGKHLTIQCQALKSVPTPTITWLLAVSEDDKNPVALQLDKRINIDEQGHLHFAFVKVSDMRNNKLYRCNSFNPNLRSTVGGSDSSLTVQQGPMDKKKPKLEISSDSVKVGLVGGVISLKCFFSGNPAPQVQWSRVGKQMPASRTLWSKDSGTLLEIRNLQESDEGEYKCQGINSQGTEEHVMNIDIQSVPVFESKKKQPHNINATEGEDITFICDPKGEPEADITWFIDGKKLNVNRPGAQRLISSDRKNLTLYKVCKDCDVGNSLMNVQCMGRNEHGSIIADGYLNVLKPTEILVPPTDVELVYGNKVIFKCETKSDDSTPVNVRWLKDDVEISYIRHHISVNSTDFSLHIRTEDDDDQGAGYKGRYICVASNDYSEVRASAVLSLPLGPVPTAGPVVKTSGGWWWIFVLIAIILLLLIILLCCCLCLQRNRGDEYSVDEKERKNGNDPEKELKDNGFQDYQRPEEEPMKGSRASLTSTIKLGESDDEGSLAEYGDIDTGKFNEDGSFLGQYHNDKKKQNMDSTV